MVVQIIKDNLIIDINNKKNVLSLPNIPRISGTSSFIFQELGSHAPDSLTDPLKTRAENLLKTVEKLKHAKENKISDKIFALIRSMFNIAIIAGGVLGTLAIFSFAPGNIGFTLAAVCLFLYTLNTGTTLGYYNGTQSGHLPSGRMGCGDDWYAFFCGPFFPIIEIFTKIDNTESDLSKQKREIIQKFSDLVTFFKQDQSELEKQLKDQILKSEKILKMISNLAVVTPAGKKEIEIKLEDYKKALEDLKKGQAFYSTFQL